MHRHMWRLVLPRKHAKMYKFKCGCGEVAWKHKFGFWIPTVVAPRFDSLNVHNLPYRGRIM